MTSADRFRAIVGMWALLALVVGIICSVGGTQAEEVVLSVVLGVLVVIGTDRVMRDAGQPEKHKRGDLDTADVDRLLDHLTDDDMDALRQRLAAQDAADSTFSPPFSR